MRITGIAAAAVALWVAGLGSSQGPKTGTAGSKSMNPLAERYVKPVLALGQHDTDYVDAYYGPPEWKTEAEAAKLTLDAIAATGAPRRADAGRSCAGRATRWSRLRHQYLDTPARRRSSARVRMLKGERLSFDEESKALYDAVAPTLSGVALPAILDRSRSASRAAVRSSSATTRGGARSSSRARSSTRCSRPPSRRAASGRCSTSRSRRRAASRSSTSRTSRGAATTGIKGDFRSLIQVNTDLPIYIDRAIDLACHEGYPGHHVYNALLEKHLVRDRGWIEFTVYPLFSPQSLIAEGTANYGIEVAFPGDERVDFERDDALSRWPGSIRRRPASTTRCRRWSISSSYAGNEAARRYLERQDRRGARRQRGSSSYAMMPHGSRDAARRFFDQYRSYVINYNLGKDLVRRYIESRGGRQTTRAAVGGVREAAVVAAAAVRACSDRGADSDLPRTTRASVSVVVNLPWRGSRAGRLRRRRLPVGDNRIRSRELVLPLRTAGNTATRGSLAAL